MTAFSQRRNLAGWAKVPDPPARQNGRRLTRRPSTPPCRNKGCSYFFLLITAPVAPVNCALPPRVSSMPDPAVEEPRLDLRAPNGS